MSNHILKPDAPPLLPQMLSAEREKDLRVACPFCKAKPGDRCVLTWTTHILRQREYEEAERNKKLPKPPSIMSLPEWVLKDIVSYCEENNIDLVDNGTINSETLMDYYLQWNGMIGYTTSIIEAWNEIKEVVK